MAAATASNKLLTRAQAAEMLGLKSQTLAKWAMVGKHLPVIKVGKGRARYRLGDVEDFIQKQTTPASD